MASSSSSSSVVGAAMGSSSSSWIAGADHVIRDQGEERAEERALTGLLPDDTLLHIMRRLPTRELLTTLAVVCHRWRRLCRAFAVYELVPCSLSSSRKPWANTSTNRILNLATTHASTLERVNLIGFRTIKSKDIVDLCQRLPKLQDLSIVSCPLLTTEDYKLIANHLPVQLTSCEIHIDHAVSSICYRSLNSRSVDSLIGISNFITDEILGDLCQRCPHLQRLDLDINSSITPCGLDGLLQSCHSLTSLDLYSHALGWHEIAQVFKSCRSLCHFSLVSDVLMFHSHPHPSSEDENMDEFSPRARSRFKFEKVEVVDASEALSGVLMPKNLRSIRIYSAPHRAVRLELSPMLKMLRSNGHQLQQLHAQGVFNTSWQTISVWCGNLKLLDLSHSAYDTPVLTEVEEVVLCGLIRLLKQLERVALPSATDRILSELGRFCSNLREIRFQSFGASRYTIYNAVTDRGVVSIAEGCPALKVLSLSGCPNVTISSARALAFHCRQLQVLILHGCSKIKDDAVVALLPRLSHSLLFLDLVGCKITQSALEAVQQYAGVTSLRVVAIAKSLWQKAPSVISEIKSLNPRLKIRSDHEFVWDGYYHGKSFD